MSQLDKYGSYAREPSISESALADQLSGAWEQLVPNERTKIGLSLNLNERSNNLTLARSLKEISASISHSIGNEVSIEYSVNVGYGNIDPQRLIFTLPGTDVLTAQLDFDKDDHVYTSRLVDASTHIDIARLEVQVASICQLIGAIGAPTRVDTKSEASLVDSLSKSLQPDSTLRVSQHHILQDEVLDESLALYSTSELTRTTIISPTEISRVTQFAETIVNGDESAARVTTFTSSEHGDVVCVEEVRTDAISDTMSRQRIDLDYDTISKIQGHLKLALANARR